MNAREIGLEGDIGKTNFKGAAYRDDTSENDRKSYIKIDDGTLK